MNLEGKIYKDLRNYLLHIETGQKALGNKFRGKHYTVYAHGQVNARGEGWIRSSCSALRQRRKKLFRFCELLIVGSGFKVGTANCC